MTRLSLHLEHHLTPPPEDAPPPPEDALPPSDASSPSIRSHLPRVAAMFGLTLDEHEPVPLIPPTRLDLEPRQLIFVTGPSGSGKSTLLRLIHHALTLRRDPAVRVIHFRGTADAGDTFHPARPLVDCFGDQTPLDTVLRVLSLAGLGDARVLLRTANELSDGQRYRLHLAWAMFLSEARPAGLTVVLADEFGATLDRLTASIIARNIRRWVRSAAVCFIAATTHDDLLEPLEPDVLIHKPLGSAMQVLTRPVAGDKGGAHDR